MERRVIPPKRVTSLSRGPPPPCKQALNNGISYLPSTATNFKRLIPISSFDDVGRHRVSLGKVMWPRLGSHDNIRERSVIDCWLGCDSSC